MQSEEVRFSITVVESVMARNPNRGADIAVNGGGGGQERRAPPTW